MARRRSSSASRGDALVGGPPHLEVDLDELTRLLDRADDADRRGLPSVSLDLLEQATALWRGPCLADGVYEEWAAPTCRDVTARFVAAAVRAAELHLAAGRVDPAVRHARRALAADQWCEPAYRVLIAAALGEATGAAPCACWASATGCSPSSASPPASRPRCSAADWPRRDA